MNLFKNNEYKNILLIFLIALGLRMILFVAVGPWHDNVANERIIPYDDAPGYHRAAILIAENKPIIAVTSKQLYMYFAGLLYSMFGYNPYVVIIFQIIMGSLTCVFLYKIGRMIFNEKNALFAGLLLAFEYSSILYSNHLLSETMFVFFLTIHIYFFMKFLTEKNMSVLVYSAVFLGITANVKPIGLYFPLFLLWPLFLHFKNNLRKGLISFFILVSVFMLFITPWMMRNYIVAGKFAYSRDSGVKTLVWFFPNVMNIFMPPYTLMRHWTEEEKRMMVKALEEQDMSIAAVVRKYGISATQLTRWQKELHEGSLATDTFPIDRKQGHFNTKIQHEDIPMKKKMINALLADTGFLVEKTFRYFATMNSGAYPEILGLPVHRISVDEWDKGLWNTLKVIVQKKSRLEWFFMCSGAGVMFYLYTTAFFGIYAAIRERKFMEIVLFVSVILYFVIASVGAFTEAQNPRQKVPTIPYLIILSCYGMRALMHRLGISSTGDVYASDSPS